MISIFKDNKEVISRYYLMTMAFAALMSRTVFHQYIDDFGLTHGECILLWKWIPWTITPLLAGAILAAYFTDKGYAKNVGLYGLFFLFASFILQICGLIWMEALDGDKAIMVQINGYGVHLPFAIIQIGVSLTKGGATALIISLLSLTKKKKDYDCQKESRLFAALGVTVSLLSIWLILARLNLTGTIFILAGALYSIILISAFFVFLKIDFTDLEEKTLVVEDISHKKALRGSLLPIAIFTLCLTACISTWLYYPRFWRAVYWGFSREYYPALAISALALAIGLITIRKRPGSAMKRKPILGSFLLLIGLPLAAALINFILLDIIAQTIVGIGAALIVSSTVGEVVKIPAKLFSTAWVIIGLAVIFGSKLMIVAFNRLELVVHSKAVAVFIIYPLIALGLVIMSYRFMERNKTEIKDYHHVD